MSTQNDTFVLSMLSGLDLQRAEKNSKTVDATALHP